MMTINDARGAKARQFRELAQRFRMKAAETQIPDYVALMCRYAAEFDRFAEDMESRSETSGESFH